jgi:hypothetical protein
MLLNGGIKRSILPLKGFLIFRVSQSWLMTAVMVQVQVDTILRRNFSSTARQSLPVRTFGWMIVGYSRAFNLNTKGD